MKRTHHCNELRPAHIGQTVTLSGWVHSRRDLGGLIFIDVRDREGRTQTVFDPSDLPKETFDQAAALRSECVVAITGRVRRRPPGTINPKITTGEIEVAATDLEVLNMAEVLPFPVDDPEVASKVNEEMRLQYRYLDLRRPEMSRRIWKVALGIDIVTPFTRLSFAEAIDRYGSDKPDTRFGMELADFSEEFRTSAFNRFSGAVANGGVVKALNAKGLAGATQGQIEAMTEFAKGFGAKGLAYIKVEKGEWELPIVKFFNAAEKAALKNKLAIEVGDLVLVA